MKEKRLNIRISEEALNELKNISEMQSKENGMKISQSNIIRKAIKEFIERQNLTCK